MAKMMTLQAAYLGGLECFYRHCIRYGTVLGYKDYMDSLGIEYREIRVIVQGCQATITKCQGEVVLCEYYQD